jgi:Acetyltransferases, including N-acetylases of ribosomal proteins
MENWPKQNIEQDNNFIIDNFLSDEEKECLINSMGSRAGNSVAKRLMEQVGKTVELSVIRNSKNELVGVIVLDNKENNDTREISYWLDEKYRGENIITNIVENQIVPACYKNNITKLIAHIFASNMPSIKTIGKLGFSEITEKEQEIDGVDIFKTFERQLLI